MAPVPNPVEWSRSRGDIEGRAGDIGGDKTRADPRGSGEPAEAMRTTPGRPLCVRGEAGRGDVVAAAPFSERPMRGDHAAAAPEVAGARPRAAGMRGPLEPLEVIYA